jgi:parallel beta-helix repeat protein
MRSTVTFLLVALATLQGRAAFADDLCGATIVADLTLDENLVCAANGLVIGADDIKVNLNGHTIAGSGAGVGIAMSGRTRITVVGGTVRNFATAVRLLDSTRVSIEDNEFLDNGEGIDLQSGTRENSIKENQFRNSSIRAIMIRGNSLDNEIKENTFSGNRVGVLIFGGVRNTLKENIVTASSLAGIRINVFATGNLVVENALTSNLAAVEFLITSTGSATGNVLVENTIALNSCGIKGPTDGNTFRENLFDNNGADSCQ